MVAETSSRRGFFSAAATTVGAVATAAVLQPAGNAVAAPTIYNLDNGVKYAITQEVTKGSYPQAGDIIAIEYTGYLSNGAIFDATHSIGKKNALLFQMGG
jgi:FKBP-type peptidyl-prolyl cis-trans isomerase